MCVQVEVEQNETVFQPRWRVDIFGDKQWLTNRPNSNLVIHFDARLFTSTKQPGSGRQVDYTLCVKVAKRDEHRLAVVLVLGVGCIVNSTLDLLAVHHTS